MLAISTALILLLGLSAQAQTAITLVSNIANANSSAGENSHDHAQAFTTGSHAHGYTVTSVSMGFRVQDATRNSDLDYEVELWNVNASSHPTTKLATLSKPNTLSTGKMHFTASNNGVSLAADTSYAVVWNVTARRLAIPPGAIMWRDTSNLSQTGESGWAIVDTSSVRAFDASASTARTDFPNSSYRITISGYESLPPATPPLRPDPSNLARSAVQWDSVGGMHPVPARIGEINSNKPSGASGSLNLAAIAASVTDELRRYSRGFYLTVMVESPLDRRYSSLLRRLDHDLARGSPLLKVRIWHVYHHSGRGTNSVELLGETFIGRPADRLAQPVQICLPAPGQDAERARIAVRGRLDPGWEILETTLQDGQLCAETTRIAWFIIVQTREDETA